jgi:GH25 family lysozyme M1 (1,4-beta-N-acetylmuramidase)
VGYLYGVDVSWPQAGFVPSIERYVIVGAVSLDGGSAFTQSTYRAQVDTARAAGKDVGHYAFNGRTSRMSVEQFADYFVDNLYDYRSGDVLVLDVESSEGGSYRAWVPDEARRFRDRVQSRIATRLGVYGNRSDMGSPGWGALRADGTWLWIAWPGGEDKLSSIGEWGDGWQMWQYDSSGGLDKNWSKVPTPVLAGKAAEEITQEIDDMKMLLTQYTGADGVQKWVQFVPGTAWFLEWQDLDGSPIASGFAQQQDVPRNGTQITQSMRDAIKAAADACSGKVA